ncbi:MAG: glycosyltransferase family 39 protein [Candidatus Binataceae bacterium]
MSGTRGEPYIREWNAASGKLLVLVLGLAALLYTFELGRPTLTFSEAYSYLAATQPDVSSVVRNAWRFDPGKPGLYHLLLHWFGGVFGTSESALRFPSVLFGLCSVLLVFAVARDLFGSEVAVVAAAIWAFNPLAVILARWARPYTLFVALALGQLLAFARVRDSGGKTRISACAALTAAMLYTHLGGLLLVGSEAALLARDYYRGLRNKAPWLALLIAAILFAPFLRWAVEQSHALLFGGFLDWMGVPHSQSSLTQVVVVVAALVIGAALVFGPTFESGELEPIRTCVAWALLPLVAVAVFSFLFHPVFNVRYVAPSIAAAGILVARGLEEFGAKIRNLAGSGLAVALLLFAPLYMDLTGAHWRTIAQTLRVAGRANEPVFFERDILTAADGRVNLHFPSGFLRPAFDYYYSGPNPRLALPDADLPATRALVAREAMRSHGAWVVSAKGEDQARAELPQSGFGIIRAFREPGLALYHVVPLNGSGDSTPDSDRATAK